MIHSFCFSWQLSGVPGVLGLMFRVHAGEEEDTAVHIPNPPDQRLS